MIKYSVSILEEKPLIQFPMVAEIQKKLEVGLRNPTFAYNRVDGAVLGGVVDSFGYSCTVVKDCYFSTSSQLI